MTVYTGLFVLLGVVVWLIIGFNFAYRIHWVFSNPYSDKRSRWKGSTMFIFNTVFWVWFIFFAVYAVLSPAERR